MRGAACDCPAHPTPFSHCRLHRPLPRCYEFEALPAFGRVERSSRAPCVARLYRVNSPLAKRAAFAGLDPCVSESHRGSEPSPHLSRFGAQRIAINPGLRPGPCHLQIVLSAVRVHPDRQVGATFRAVSLPTDGPKRIFLFCPARSHSHLWPRDSELLDAPATVGSTRGTEFVSRDLDLWAYQRGVTLDFSRPGKPTDNAFIEAFNGQFRAECLNAHWFLSLADAREKLEVWRKYYNEERPHGAIGHKTPIMLLNHVGASSPPP